MAASSGTRRGNGCGKGQGWGGPAKGAGSDAPSFSDSLENRIGGVAPNTAELQLPAAIKAMTREQQNELVKDEILRIALLGQRENDRINAGREFADRTEGKSIARNLNINGEFVDRTDDELRAEFESLAGRVGAGGVARTGIAAPGSEKGPADLGN